MGSYGVSEDGSALFGVGSGDKGWVWHRPMGGCSSWRKIGGAFDIVILAMDGVRVGWAEVGSYVSVRSGAGCRGEERSRFGRW